MSHAGPPPSSSGSGEEPDVPYGAPERPGSPYLPGPDVEHQASPYGTPPPTPTAGYGQEPPAGFGAAPPGYGPAGQSGSGQSGYGQSDYGQSDYGAPPAAPYGTPTPATYGTPAPMYGAVSPYATTGTGQANGLAVTALILSCLGMVCGGVFAVVGLILSIQARKAVAQGRASNGGVATAALVVSIVTLSLWALIWLIAIVPN